MPHIKVENFDIDSFTPFEKNGVKFKNIAKGQYDNKILVEFENSEFLLTIKDDNKTSTKILKYDKITRINPVETIKNSLNLLAQNLNLTILKSNTSISHSKAKPQISYLKTFDFFLENRFDSKNIVVEVGFGSGTQLLHLAKKNPDTIYIGLEIHNPSIEQVLKHIKIENINNIYLINYDARAFLEILESNSLSGILVHFPVPWDKKPHRRVICNEFIVQSIRTLKVGSKLHLRTDSDNYFEYSKEEFLNFNQVDLKIQKNINQEVVSKYEARWKRQEKDIYDIFFSSLETSPNIDIKTSFDFKEIDFKKIVNLPKDAIVKDNFFIHFEELYRVKCDDYLLKITFGDFNRPEHQYILLKDNNLSRYFSSVAPIKANIEAHKEIVKYVCK